MFNKSDEDFLKYIFQQSKKERAERIQNLSNWRLAYSILAGFLIVLYIISRFDFADSLPAKNTGIPLSGLFFIVKFILMDFEIKFLKFAEKLEMKKDD